MKYYALVYPAWCDQPDVIGNEPCFGTAEAAWAWLKVARQQEEDRHPDWNIGVYSDTVSYLDYAGTECDWGNPYEDWPLASDGTGAIRGATPGVGHHAFEDGVNDPGVIYAVVAR